MTGDMVSVNTVFIALIGAVAGLAPVIAGYLSQKAARESAERDAAAARETEKLASKVEQVHQVTNSNYTKLTEEITALRTQLAELVAVRAAEGRIPIPPIPAEAFPAAPLPAAGPSPAEAPPSA